MNYCKDVPQNWIKAGVLSRFMDFIGLYNRLPLDTGEFIDFGFLITELVELITQMVDVESGTIGWLCQNKGLHKILQLYRTK